MLAYIVCAVIGAISILKGYVVLSKNKLSLVAGYHKLTFKGDEKRLVRWSAISSFFVGVFMILLPIILTIFGSIIALFATAVALAVSTGMTVYGNYSVEKRK